MDSAQKNKLNALDVTGNDNNFNNITNMKYLAKGEVLLIWLVNDSDNFEELKESAEATFDWNNIGWIVNEDVGRDPSIFKSYVRKLFYLE